MILDKKKRNRIANISSGVLEERVAPLSCQDLPEKAMDQKRWVREMRGTEIRNETFAEALKGRGGGEQDHALQRDKKNKRRGL